MEHFLFAMQAVFPTACILFCGYGLKQIGIFSKEFLQQGDRLCFSFLFPILVFWNLYHDQTNQIRSGQCGKAILFAYGMILIVCVIGMWIIPKVIEERGRIPVVIQSLYRGNFMLYGLPFSEILGGKDALMIATAMTAATLPILNAVAIFQFAYYSGNEKRSIYIIFAKIFKNPIIWGVLLGLFFQKTNIQLPDMMETTLSDLAKTATPLAFLILGGRFHFRSVQNNRKILIWILLFKLCILPIICLSFCSIVLHMSRTELIPIFIFVSAPTAITTYQLAGQYEADAELAGDIVVYSLLFSTITIFLFIFLLKKIGWI